MVYLDKKRQGKNCSPSKARYYHTKKVNDQTKKVTMKKIIKFILITTVILLQRNYFFLVKSTKTCCHKKSDSLYHYCLNRMGKKELPAVHVNATSRFNEEVKIFVTLDKYSNTKFRGVFTEIKTQHTPGAKSRRWPRGRI